MKTNSAQAINGQIDRDKSVVELTEAMEDAFTFVDELKAFPDKIQPLQVIIRKILEETYGGCTLRVMPWGMLMRAQRLCSISQRIYGPGLFQ